MPATPWPAVVLELTVLGMAVPVIAQTSPFQRSPEQGSAAPPRGTLRESSGRPPPGALYIPEQPGNALLVTEYLGRPVYGPDKQRVGTISNLLVDVTGRVTGVVLEVGGFLGLGSKEVAISFEALYPVHEDDQDRFLVEMNKAQLTAAPPFKRAK